MKAVIYASKALLEFSPEYITSMTATFAQHNHENNVTGYLWYRNHEFLQYIEGDSKSIDRLMLNITRDSRHSIMSSLCTTIELAKFSTWDMKYLGKQENTSVYLGLVSTLSSQLLLIAANKIENGKSNPSVWRLVDILAKYQSNV
jgi:hypothetical protein